MKFLTTFLCAGIMLSAAAANAAIIINEIHYDNASTDVGEFLEIVTTAGEAAADITVSLYNGSDDELYGNGSDTFNLASDFTDHGVLTDGAHYYSLTFPSNGLQNGGPDGVAVDLGGVVQDTISYEGSSPVGPAGDGPAIGLTFTDIGVIESSATSIGSSLQRLAFGPTWFVTEGSNSQGGINIPEPGTAILALLGATLAGAASMRSRLG